MKSRIKISRTVVLLCLAVVVIGFLASMWFLANYERKSKDIRSGYSLFARQNPLLAATHYLQKLGFEAESHQGRDLLANLPPVGDALLLFRQGGSLSPTQLDELYHWIDAGSHLVVVPKRMLAADDEIGEDDITSRLGVKLRDGSKESNCDCNDDDEEATDADADADTSTSTSTDSAEDEAEAEVEVETEDESSGEEETSEEDESSEPEPIQVELDGTGVMLEFGEWRFLEEGDEKASQRIATRDGEGAHLLQYQMGAGKITVLSSSSVFSNYQLEKSDHGWLLSWLVRDNQKTWLLYSNNMDGVFTLLGRNMPRFLVSLAGLILFALWFWQYRIGPLQESAQNGRRNILAHIEGLGRYSWECDRAASLVAGTRESVLQYWATRVPGNGHGDSRVDPAAVAEKTGLNRKDVEFALYGEVTSEHDLVVVSRCLQKLQQSGVWRI